MSGYELRDPLCPSFVEESTHVAIYKLEYSGERTLRPPSARTTADHRALGDAGHAVGGEYKQLGASCSASPRPSTRRAPPTRAGSRARRAESAPSSRARASRAPARAATLPASTLVDERGLGAVTGPSSVAITHRCVLCGVL